MKRHGHIIKCNKSILKGYILYDSSHMTFWKRLNYGDSKNFNGGGGHELREEG